MIANSDNTTENHSVAVSDIDSTNAIENSTTPLKSGRRKTKIKYVEDDFSDGEEEITKEKRRRARQLDSEQVADVGYPLLDIIVGRRINKSTGAVEYLVKFHGRSYLHLWWLTFPEVEAFIEPGYQMHHRVQVYDRKLRRDGYADLDDVDDFEVNKVTVEKILNHKMDPKDSLDEQIEKRRAEVREKLLKLRYPRVSDYFLLDNTEELPKRLKGIVEKLLNENGGEVFKSPVDTKAIPEYLNIITNPMDLGTIRNRLNKENYYIGPAAVSLFYSEVQLVFTNCMTFNTPQSDIWKLAEELLEQFQKWIYDWVYCPTSWLQPLENSSGETLESERAALAFVEKGENPYDVWCPWLTGCTVCHQNSDSEKLLLCDRCDGEVHMYCIEPELDELPTGEWFCDFCKIRNTYEAQAKVVSDKIESHDIPEVGSSDTKSPRKGNLSKVKSPSKSKSENSHKPKTIPRIQHKLIEESKKYNPKRGITNSTSSGNSSSKHPRATYFLVKWLGLSIRYSTWERPQDIANDEQIQRYLKFSRVPTSKEILETTCQLPCCASKNQMALARILKRNCEKDQFCVLGYQHSEPECARERQESREILPYGSPKYQTLRVHEQIKAQLFAFHCLLNNHAPDANVLRQCGVASHAYVCKTSMVENGASDVEDLGEDEEYSSSGDSSSDEEDYDIDEDLDDDEMELAGVKRRRGRPSSFPLRRPVIFAGIQDEADDDDDDDDDDDTQRKYKPEDEVGEVLSAMIEHVVMGYPTELQKVPEPPPPAFNSAYPASYSTNQLSTFTEYGVALRKTPLGLGMRLGVPEQQEGSVSVLGFQPLANGMPGPAELARVIHVGDILAAVNTVSVRNLPFTQIIQLIQHSQDFVLFHFHTIASPASAYPHFCHARQVTLEQPSNHLEGTLSSDARETSQYINYSYYQYQSMLKVSVLGRNASGVRIAKAANLSSIAAENKNEYITPSGPMQHLYAGICDNSIDPHEHFASFLPPSSSSISQIEKMEISKSTDEFIPYEQSPTFKGGRTLRPYQVEGLNWMISCWKAQRSCILADEMGLGKTVQVVSFLDHLKSEESIRGPFLIVVPLSTIQHWRREIETWTDLNVCVYHDIGDVKSKFTAKDMRAVLRNQEWYYPSLGPSIFKFNILLTTFETILPDFEEFEPIHWRMVVVDEAHRLKSSGSRVLKQMRVLNVDRKLLLTGTPLQNNTQELWVLLNYLDPVKFNSMENFNAKYGVLQSQEQVVELQKLLGPYLLRRVKDDVEKSIPPKEETIIAVELTTLQKQYYRAIYDKNRSFLYRGTKNGLPTLNNIQLQLRKCCNHPFLIKGVEERELADLGEFPDPNSLMEKTIACSGKFVLVAKLLPKLQREGHKVLIFSQFIKQLDLLERYCEYMNFGYERLDGGTSGSVRQNAIDRFSRPNAKSFIFLLSTKAGGVGINLIAADTVIIFDSDWNPQNDLQAQSRCHRIGQKQSVRIYRLVTRNTYESEMFDRASRKLGLEHAILGTASFSETSMVEKPSAEQLVELLKRGAYALMEDEAGDAASREFAERDIETILKENAHVRLVVNGKEVTENDGQPGLGSHQRKMLKQTVPRRKMRKSLGGIAVDRSSFVAEGSSGELAVDDPNFWEKVLPGAISIEMLSLKLSDGSALSSRTSKTQFMANLEIALNELRHEMSSNGKLQSTSSSRVDAEYDMAMHMLHELALKHRNELSKEHLDKVKTFLSKLEKSRVRSCRGNTSSVSASRQDKKRKGSWDIDDTDTNDKRIDEEDEPYSDDGKKNRQRKKSKQHVFTSETNPFEGVINDSDDLCTLCGDGGLILLCDGPCHRSFHLDCVGMSEEPEDEHWLCPDCSAGRHTCLICKQVGDMGVEFGVIQCSQAKCGRFYHKGCLAKHDLVQWVGKKRFRCPSHFCHGCKSEKPPVPEVKGKRTKKKKGKEETKTFVVRCIHCAESYHPECIPSTSSGSFFRLSLNLMICTNHLKDEDVKSKDGRKKKLDINGGKSAQFEENQKLCAFCNRPENSEASAKKKSSQTAKNGSKQPNWMNFETPDYSNLKTVEGALLDGPIRIQTRRGNKSFDERVHVHINCALHSPEVFIHSSGVFRNIPRAVKRGRQLKCTHCKELGATVGCVVDTCKCNYHLRCAVKSGGEFLLQPYELYCKEHAEEKKMEMGNGSDLSNVKEKVLDSIQDTMKISLNPTHHKHNDRQSSLQNDHTTEVTDETNNMKELNMDDNGDVQFEVEAEVDGHEQNEPHLDNKQENEKLSRMKRIRGKRASLKQGPVKRVKR